MKRSVLYVHLSLVKLNCGGLEPKGKPKGKEAGLVCGVGSHCWSAWELRPEIEGKQENWQRLPPLKPCPRVHTWGIPLIWYGWAYSHCIVIITTEPEPTARQRWLNGKTVHTTSSIKDTRKVCLDYIILKWTYNSKASMPRKLNLKELRIDPHPIKWGLDV